MICRHSINKFTIIIFNPDEHVFRDMLCCEACIIPPLRDNEDDYTARLHQASCFAHGQEWHRWEVTGFR